MKTSKTITSFKEFHQLVPTILKHLNDNQALALRALANPLLAFDEMGYRLSPGVSKEVERIIRFSPAQRKILEKLEADLSKFTKRKLEYVSAKDVASFLSDDLKIEWDSKTKLGTPSNAKKNAEEIMKNKKIL